MQWIIAESEGRLDCPLIQDRIPGRYDQLYRCHAAQVESRVFCWATKPYNKRDKKKKFYQEIQETTDTEAALFQYVNQTVFYSQTTKPLKTNDLPKYVRYAVRGFKVEIRGANVGIFPTIKDAVLARNLFLNVCKPKVRKKYTRKLV